MKSFIKFTDTRGNVWHVDPLYICGLTTPVAPTGTFAILISSISGGLTRMISYGRLLFLDKMEFNGRDFYCGTTWIERTDLMLLFKGGLCLIQL